MHAASQTSSFPSAGILFDSIIKSTHTAPIDVSDRSETHLSTLMELVGQIAAASSLVSFEAHTTWGIVQFTRALHSLIQADGLAEESQSGSASSKVASSVRDVGSALRALVSEDDMSTYEFCGETMTAAWAMIDRHEETSEHPEEQLDFMHRFKSHMVLFSFYHLLVASIINARGAAPGVLQHVLEKLRQAAVGAHVAAESVLELYPRPPEPDWENLTVDDEDQRIAAL